jgi:hypothetical protein
MPRLIEQNGARVKTGWPVQFHRYEPDKLPDPADVLDCPLIVNDRSDGVPRGRVVVSNGASYDTVAYLTDIPAGSPAVALAKALPALPDMPPPPPLPAINIVGEVSRQIAALRPVVASDPVLSLRVDTIERIAGELSARVSELERIFDELKGAAAAIRSTKGR